MVNTMVNWLHQVPILTMKLIAIFKVIILMVHKLVELSISSDKALVICIGFVSAMVRVAALTRLNPKCQIFPMLNLFYLVRECARTISKLEIMRLLLVSLQLKTAMLSVMSDHGVQISSTVLQVPKQRKAALLTDQDVL